MPQQELLVRLVRTLDDLKIPYMLTGSMASSLQGEPRSTHDIDILVALQESSLKGMTEAFPPSDFYLYEPSIRAAIDEKSMFNVINTKEGDKIDFWILTDEPFDRSRFARKIEEKIMGIGVQVSTPEDTILAKLKWAVDSGGSEKQFTDALRVYEVQYELLNFEYLSLWVGRLGLGELWNQLRQRATPL